MSDKRPLESQLVEGLRNRNVHSLDALYEKYSSALYGVILRIVQDETEAQDLLQECFMKIWNKIETFDNKRGRLFTWMLNIARNTAIDFTRSRRYKTNEKSQPLLTAYSYSSELSEQMSTDQIGLQELVEKLKPEQKVIIDLLYFEGYTQSEAAKKLDIPLGTVKTRVRAALRILKNITYQH